ncbi:MAG: hypothetical protein K8R06_06215 [Methanosarcinales archaeon]|nr:hypothetical protein [Methanosarcinales archaeon]MCD4815977.1 hypothetical protein [Methanosarcinales archaeon]
MLEPTLTTWILIIFGLVFIFLPMLCVQLRMVLRPNNRKTRDIIIGKGEDWRDKTHFRMSLGAGWADLMIWLPLLAAGSVGVILGQVWGYALWAASGAISVYVNIILWFSEREYVYPACGPLVYYTYFWGFFVYWGVAVVVYTVLRLAGVTL